jgi:alpha-L-rhamnosidase
LLTAVAVPAFAAAPLAPTNLIVDDVSNPVGTEAVPYFGWLDNDTNANEIQTGYEILVATTSSNLDANIGDAWDSGEIAVSQENHVVYAGTPLTADTEYFWKVRTWNREGNVGAYSTNAAFEVGLLANTDWSGAMWIQRNTNVADDYTYYRKWSPVLSTTNIQRATVYVTSVHKYALYVNGTLVGKGPTYQFPQYQYYNAYDITPLITPGTTNLFAIFNHWFGGGSGRPTSVRGVLMKAIIHYTDGTSANIVTDGTWLQSAATNWATGQTKRGDSGYVEKIYAGSLTTNWFTTGFDDSAWATATVIGGQPNSTWSGNLTPDLARIVETGITPVSVTNMGGGQYMVDLGRVYSGVPSISFSGGTAGTTINMLGGFALLSSGLIDTSQNQSTVMNDYAVLNGSPFTYQPIQYQTMRYFWISNSPMPVTTNNFAFIERNSRMNDAASSFTSSNATLNAVWDLMKHTLPVDAQEEFIDSMRQEGGFLGDGYQESLAAMQVEDERVLTRNRLNDFIASMVQFWSTPAANVGRVNACYPDVNNARDIPDYTQMYLDWVWEYYLQTGDRAFLATNYSALTNIAQYVSRSVNPANGLITKLLGGTSGSYTNGIIDWPPTDQFGYDLTTVRSPGNAATVINGWAWEDYDIVSRIANEIGNTADSNTYRAMANALQSAINTNLLNASGVYVDGLIPGGAQSAHASQHANAFPLSLGIVPPAQMASVTAQVDSLGMSVSALGIIQLERALGEANQGPALLNIYTNANQYGWAQILSLGGTATWESWIANVTPGDSESHGWQAVGLDGYVRYILGVKPLKTQFEQVQIMPLDFGNILPSASGTLLTDRGTIAVEWDRSATLYHLAVTIPVNVTATIYVPQTALTNTTVSVDGTNVTGTLTNLDGTSNGYVGVSGIGSGTHNIQRVIETPPIAGFSGTTTNGIAPLVVTFTNLSSNATNYFWNFGDGNTLSTSANTNVTDTYSNAGSYTVILTATGQGGTNTLTNTAYIVVTPPVQNTSQIITNADNGGNLTAGTSWIGGVAPGATNVALFDSIVTGANPSRATNVLGADTTWGEIQILNPSVPVQISAGNTLTLNGLNSSGIDMSHATTSLTLNSAMALGAAQFWLVTNNQTLFVNGVVSGNGFPLTINGGAANGNVFFGTQANTYTGDTTINGGIVQLKAAASLGTGTITNNGATMLISSALTITNNLVFNNTSLIDLNNVQGSPALNGAWSGNGTVIISNLVFSPSTLTIGGNIASSTMNNFTGKFIIAPMNSAGLISQGSIRFNSGNTPYNFGSASASFNLGTNGNAISLTSREGGTINLGELTGGPATVLLGSRTTAGTTVWSVGGLNTSTTFAGVISNYTTTEISALTKVGTGTLTLTGTNTGGASGSTGTIMVSAGTLQIGDGNADGTLTAGNVTVAGGAALVFDRPDNYTVTNNISNAGTLTILGGGTNNYTGNDSGSGSITVSNATLSGSGNIGGMVNVQAGGILAPGAGVSTVGTVLTINSNLTLASDSTSIMKVSHNNHNNDQVVATGISYGGTLTVITNAGDAPLASGDSFQLFNAVTYAGSFATSNLPPLSPGLGWSNNLAVNGSVAVVLSPPMVTNFKGTPRNGLAPLAVIFENTSTGTTNWVWNFGDGNAITNISGSNVTNTYANAGSYTVTLTVYGPGGTYALTNTAYIVVTNNASAPVAGFTGAPTNLFVTQTVTFTDASTGSITNWVWNFGDGNTLANNSNASVPHAYAAAGNYTVNLTVNGPGGSSGSTQTAYIMVKPKAVLGVVMMAGGNLVFSGTNGPPGMQYRILTTTNVALPLGNWTPVWTNIFGTDGSYGYTNPPGLNPAGFFLLTSP